MVARRFGATAIAFICCVLLLNTIPTWAQQTEAAQPGSSTGGAGELQKAVQNPVASLISVPVQNNNNLGLAPTTALKMS